MKRTAIILITTLLLIVSLCSAGIFTAEKAEDIRRQAEAFETACLAQDAAAARNCLDVIEDIWARYEGLFAVLCRMETCLAIDRTIEEMELALSSGVFEDGISASRELQRACGEAAHVGLPEWSDVL